MGHYKIGEVARLLNLSPRRVYEYERAGLIHPIREPATNNRLYDEHEVSQLRSIRSCLHDMGLSVQALRHLMRYAPCWELTDCPAKDRCPVVRNPLLPCYVQRAAGAVIPRNADCERCPIRGAKDTPRHALVVPPVAGDNVGEETVPQPIQPSQSRGSP